MTVSPTTRSSRPLRVRFCPSPTGNPHVGLIRTALFNWAFARHSGGTFVLRIEDTDAARDTEESYTALLDVLRWLRLDWDEGPEVGGAFGPYRQSERKSVYEDAIWRLVTGGYAYDCYCTQEEIEARNKAAGRPPGYDNYCRTLSIDEMTRFSRRKRPSVLRFRMPDRTITWIDLVRGEISIAPEHVPDYVIVRSNGEPLYTLVNPVDDGLMMITHVLRGEDLLSSTPRQIALYEALGAVGVTGGEVPEFGHLPYVMGEGNKKLSKRDPESSVNLYRERGFLPEGLLNYLALLGWSIAEDRDIFSMREMAEAFALADVNANPARFDVRKAEAINGTWVRRLDPADLTGRLVPFLQVAGLVHEPPTGDEQRLLAAAVPLVQERVAVLTEAVDMLRFLFSGDGFALDEDSAAKVLTEAAGLVLAAAQESLAGLRTWEATAIEGALKGALVEGLGLKPRAAFAPVRVAVTGRTISPPLYESVELLGRERTLARLADASARLGQPGPVR
ncbi:MAG: glutamate--tRNA ligase [Pseudonocardiales bacterium]|nr:MAG: glutamate--tRNA ligase [Pseudonocardiales bacterium]